MATGGDVLVAHRSGSLTCLCGAHGFAYLELGGDEAPESNELRNGSRTWTEHSSACGARRRALCPARGRRSVPRRDARHHRNVVRRYLGWRRRSLIRDQASM